VIKGLPLASSTWDEKEIVAAKRVIDSGNTTMGLEVAEFEDKFAQVTGSKFAVMFNSGSSANLAMLFSLKYSKEHGLRPGSEVIVPAVSWSTTYYPVSQAGFRLRFVDVNQETLNIDLNEVEKNINRNTGAILAVNLLGNPADLQNLRRIAESHGLVLIEDNCESLGAELEGKQAGTFGVAGSFSFFFSHHICTMEGGMVVTDSKELDDILRSLRAHGWTRGLSENNFVHPLSSDSWEDLYRFVLPGFNLRPVEISGAVGKIQLEKLEDFIFVRRRNAETYRSLFGESDHFRIQTETGKSSWFGFPFILTNNFKGKRAKLLNLLTSNSIETRPIVAGNFLRNPVMKHLDHIAEGNFSNADEIHTDGFFVGNHHFDIGESLCELKEMFNQFQKEVIL
jgi:CDP-6-deoxy-D-xylo-4-hexulose-3-dehydrase